MEDNSSVKIGDELMCISNEGLMSMGNCHLIYGLTEKSINVSNSHTGWQSRSDFRWRCYKHFPLKGELPESVVRFQNKQKEVDESNIQVRKTVASRLANNPKGGI